jgi:PAS domain-containing protein
MSHHFETAHEEYVEFAATDRVPFAQIETINKQLLASAPLKAFLLNMPIPVVIVEAHRQVVFANMAAQKMVGQKLSHSLGLRLGEFLGVNHRIDNRECNGQLDTCANCNSHPIIMAALGGKKAAAEGIVTLFNDENDAQLSYRMQSTPFEIEAEPLALLTFVPASN